MGRASSDNVGQTSCKRYKVYNGTFTWWISEKPTQYWTQESKKNCKYEKETKLFWCNDPGKNPYYGIQIKIFGKY